MTPAYQDAMVSIYCGNAAHVLYEMESESVQCVVTSPPYWGLRDYGTMGQVGLESTPQEYVAVIVDIFAQVRRVLKNDGTLFLNLGDSYFSSGGERAYDSSDGGVGRGPGTRRHDVRRAIAYDSSDKAPEDSREHGCLCENLCGVCREVCSRIAHRDPVLVSMLRASLRGPSHEHIESSLAHSPTLDCLAQEARNASAMQGRGETSARDDGPLLALLSSMIGESSPQLLDVCLQRANHVECLLCARSLVGCVPASADKSGCTCDSEQRGSASRKLGKDVSDSAYQYLTMPSLKSKDLVGIPWMVAFALRQSGWYLRSDIIWAKPNPMPESVTDRPTKSHEYVFLMSKSERYFFNQDAVKQPITCDRMRGSGPMTNPLNGDRNDSDQRGDYRLRTNGKHNKTEPQAAGRRIVESVKTARANGAPHDNPFGFTRNIRSVWTIPTQPYNGAHFAVFPEDLVKPCVLAGSRPGDVVLDCFSGSGTALYVAKELGRRGIGIELNREYVGLAAKRLRQEVLNFNASL